MFYEPALMSRRSVKIEVLTCPPCPKLKDTFNKLDIVGETYSGTWMFHSYGSTAR